MIREVLEQVVRKTPNVLDDQFFETVDVNLYPAGAVAFYSDPSGPVNKPSTFGQIAKLPRSPINPAVIPYGNETGMGGDMHETFKIDRHENTYGGHTSIKIPGFEPYRVPWPK